MTKSISTPAHHTISFRIYYEDTDAAGIVYHSNYLKFAERARTEWLRELGFSQSKLLRDPGIGLVVRHCAIDFLASARLDDLITVETHLPEMGKVRMTMQQEIRCAETVLVKLSVLLACVGRTGKPERWPEALASRLAGA